MENAAEATASVTEASHQAEPAVSGMSALLHSPDTWILVSFLVFIAVAVRYVAPMITKGLDERSNKIRDQLEQASRLRAEAEALLSNYRAQQEALLKEAEALVANAKSDAESMRAQAAQELKAALERRNQQAQEKIARAEAEAINDIRKRVIDTATETARTLLAGEAGRPANTAAVNRAMDAIEKKLA